MPLDHMLKNSANGEKTKALVLCISAPAPKSSLGSSPPGYLGHMCSFSFPTVSFLAPAECLEQLQGNTSLLSWTQPKAGEPCQQMSWRRGAVALGGPGLFTESPLSHEVSWCFLLSPPSGPQEQLAQAVGDAKYGQNSGEDLSSGGIYYQQPQMLTKSMILWHILSLWSTHKNTWHLMQPTMGQVLG